MSQHKNPWYMNLYGPKKELRVLFSKLLEEGLGMTSGSGHIPRNININTTFICSSGRPFTNIFNRNKNENNVFTKKILGDFLELALRLNKINEVIQIIESSKFKEAINPTGYRMEKITNCINIKEEIDGLCKYGRCIEKIINGESFNKECEDCPIKWIYTSLQKIESNYWEIVSEDKNISRKFLCQSDEILIDKIYEDIISFESKFGESTCNEIQAIELFNSCIRCFEIQDVANKKLAYVKWYTAHLCNWPYLKSCLLQVNHYDENTIYSLLASASKIMKVVNINDGDLLGFIESEKIISYISLAYQNPFAMGYCESYDDIITNCMRILSLKISDNVKLTIYIELWNLSIHTLKYLKADKYKLKIDDMLNKSLSTDNKWKEAKAKYYTYQYMYNTVDSITVENLLKKTAKDLRDRKMYSDSFEVISEVFLNKDKKSGDIFKTINPHITLKAIKGFEPTEERIKKLPDCPSNYQRVFGDNQLITFFENYRS